jgi:hypothetical protein
VINGVRTVLETRSILAILGEPSSNIALELEQLAFGG